MDTKDAKPGEARIRAPRIDELTKEDLQRRERVERKLGYTSGTGPGAR